MKKFILALSDDACPNFKMLSPVIEISNLNIEIYIHRTPIIKYDDLEVVSNFDYFIDFSYEPDSLIKLLLPDKYINIPRHSKTRQFINIRNFNLTRGNKTRLLKPNNYHTIINSNNLTPLAQIGTPLCEYVVIKNEFGARGTDQVKLPTKFLISFFDNAIGATYEEIKKLPYVELSSKYHDIPFSSVVDLTVTEFIPNISKEWRIIVSGDNIVAREREINTDLKTFPQANLPCNYHEEISYEPLSSCFSIASIEVITSFINYIGMKFGSIDLYVTNDGDLGIFEYSTEYGTSNLNLLYMKELLLNSLTSILTPVLESF